jgi:hypothetical protein
MSESIEIFNPSALKEMVDRSQEILRINRALERRRKVQLRRAKLRHSKT